jgi:hypothetical protein
MEWKIEYPNINPILKKRILESLNEILTILGIKNLQFKHYNFTVNTFQKLTHIAGQKAIFS